MGRKLEPTDGVEQGGNDTSVAAVLERDEERQTQGGIIGYVEGSLDDDASTTVQGDELAKEEGVEKEATANQR